MLGDFAAFGGEKNASAALDFDVAIAGHALERSSDCGWGDSKLFGETGANGHLVLFKHFPDGLEVILPRNAGFVTLQDVSLW